MRYALLIQLLAPLFFVFAWWRGRREPAWREHWPQRRGWVPVAHTASPVWLHAASVGEVNSAASMLRAIQTQYPQLPLYLTAFTPTGVSRWQALAPGAVVSLLPLDVPVYWRRFFQRVQPRALLVLETECWPHLLLACQQQQVPVSWLSARLGASSKTGMPRLFGRQLLQRALQDVQVIAAQTETDADRFAALGARADRISVVGSLKQDLSIAVDLPVRAQAWREGLQRTQVWLAASTHEGEERIVLEAHQQLLQQYPDALLLLAPRHPRRADEVAGLLDAVGLSWQRRSNVQQPQDEQVFLLDTLGELLFFYATCDVAFVGGSLVPIGGHNLLEPAALNKPILSGPHLHTCADTAQPLQALGALQIVLDAASLFYTLRSCLDNSEDCQRRGQAAGQYAASQRGALQRSMELLAPLLRSDSAD
ncbi:MAG: 3-deoxy-D-manno-octulosonic acid transferase [Oceanococcus sp.]